ncbi:MAG: hypothetical protein AAFQ36_02050 [Pseudomonadota bacterium]
MVQYTVDQAFVVQQAQTILRAYKNKADFIEDDPKRGQARAYITKGGTLVIRGTDSGKDLIRFGLDFNPAHKPGLGSRIKFLSEYTKWFPGYVEHAALMLLYVKELKPRFLLGHSMGGAACAVLGSRLRIPTLTFACPGVVDGRRRGHNSRYVLNIVRGDDWIPSLTTSIFKHKLFGDAITLSANDDPVEAHFMKNYAKLVAWPRFSEEFDTVLPRVND